MPGNRNSELGKQVKKKVNRKLHDIRAEIPHARVSVGYELGKMNIIYAVSGWVRTPTVTASTKTLFRQMLTKYNAQKDDSLPYSMENCAEAHLWMKIVSENNGNVHAPKRYHVITKK